MEVCMSNRLLFGDPARLHVQSMPQRLQLPVWSAMRAAWRRYRTRQRIVSLDSHMLKDIGVSFADAEAEANKSFWRV
jgi:uncharacterized protein YjiS (DUF1127 family)